MSKKLLYASFIVQILFSDTYKDRIKVYIENSYIDFQLDVTESLSNNNDLNNLMVLHGANKIDYWLPNALPADRDGDVYLNRFYIIYFEESSVDISQAYKDFDQLDIVKNVEYVRVITIDYTPNDPYWNQQWGLDAIEAALAYDLWDIDGGEIPGQMEAGEMVVGIPDNGYKWNHPDLVDNVWQNLGEDADGDGVVIIQSGGTWIFDPGDINGIDDDGDNYVDNFVGWDAAFGGNDPSPVNNNFDHGTLVGGCVAKLPFGF